MNLTLLRLPSQPSYTEGLLLLDGKFFSYTLELPWKDNAPNVSCIPFGVYPLTVGISAHFSEKVGIDVWLPEIQNVPGRTGILIHGGNTSSDSLGCVLVCANKVGPGEIQGSLASSLTAILKADAGPHRISIFQAS